VAVTPTPSTSARRSARSAATLALGLLTMGPAARAQEAPPAAPAPAANVLLALEEAVADIARRVRPAVVEVHVERTLVLPPAEPRSYTVAASGVVWDEVGHVVSLGRVFEGATAVTIGFASGERRPAEVLGVDEQSGLALLKVDPEGLAADLLRPAPRGDAARLRAGSIVVQIGNPFGLGGSVAIGNVAATGRVLKRGSTALTDMLQVTTPVNPGDPGSALCDARGELVGLVASSYDRGVDAEDLADLYERVIRAGQRLLQRGAGTEPGPTDRAEADEAGAAPQRSAFGGQSVGFAIPIGQVAAVVDRLKERGRVERSWIGVQVLSVDPVLKSQLGLPTDRGLLVVGVIEGGPADRAGLRRHDILVRCAEEDVADVRRFQELIFHAPAGVAVPVRVLRGGVLTDASVTPVVRPKR
jgi:S1-C subfamily serine protease